MEAMEGALFLVLMLCASWVSPATAGEAAALLHFKESSIDVDPKGFLKSWTSSSSQHCFWAGVICSPADGLVRGLNLSNMALAGRLRIPDLMALPNLRLVDLHGNLFYGNLSYSKAAASLPCSFETVDLSANNFTGSLPSGFLSSCPRLTSLNLSRNSVMGGIFPYPSSLRLLDLSRNQISDAGLLNFSLSDCNALTLLNLSDNRLAGRLSASPSPSCTNLTSVDLSHNLFSGDIPADFVSPSLQLLDLSHNNFSGDFSRFHLGSNLEVLDVSGNHLRGLIPPLLGRLTGLKRLSLGSNLFTGEIPPELGQTCGTLAELDVSENQLTGELPSTFTGCSSLRALDLGSNQLSGDFMRTVVGTMISLRYLSLAFNNLSGPVPLPALANCTSLETIDLSSNKFTGDIHIPGFCSSHPNLERLLMSDNLLTGTVPSELGNCSNLKSIDLSFNYLVGPIPLAVWSLPNLSDLIMWANNLSGEIPGTLCGAAAAAGGGLETLILSHNSISGSIPSSITACLSLIWVSLSGNRLVGDIPSNVGRLQNLAILQLGNNSLSGQIPPELGSCRNLIWLDLNSNGLTGPIPPSLASQTGLISPGIVSGKQFAFLRNAAGNICPGAGELFEFEGIRQERLANFPLVHSCPATRIYTGTTVYSYTSNGSMIYLDLSYNSLMGTIPPDLGSMNYLQVMNLGHNELSGRIPESFSGLQKILGLDLSHNNLTGTIPGVLGTLTFLDDLDVSNNNLSGQIPSGGQLTTFPASRYENNPFLCGVPLSPCGSGGAKGGSGSGSGDRRRFSGSGSIMIGVALSVLIILLLSLALYKMKQQQPKQGERIDGNVEELHASGAGSFKFSGVLEPLSINVATFEKPLRKLTFAHLLEATNGFSANSMIGSGGFGEVFKANLGDGSVVAIKKLIHVTGQGDREFTAEMETIGKIKHRNLVPLLGYCKIGDERLLVYEYMKYGSLDMVLHDKKKKLDWTARKKVAIGAARGLAFLHHSCIPHIIHRDMKSSNVLIDENLEARVSDFGMARLMNALDTHLSVSTLAGTPGYVPPEYYQSFRCTTKGDVYSYGVVLLELVSGKKPIDPLEFGDNNLVGWAKHLMKEKRSAEIFDSELMRNKSGEAELYRYLRIAYDCLDDRPLRRPTMIQVMAMFKELQVDSDSDFLEGLSIGRTIVEESSSRETTTTTQFST